MLRMIHPTNKRNFELKTFAHLRRFTRNKFQRVSEEGWEPIVASWVTRPTSLDSGYSQCDQAWRNFATLAKI